MLSWNHSHLSALVMFSAMFALIKSCFYQDRFWLIVMILHSLVILNSVLTYEALALALDEKYSHFQLFRSCPMSLLSFAHFVCNHNVIHYSVN